MSAERLYHFALTKKQADALVEIGVALEGIAKRNTPFDRATLAIEEQMQLQNAPWERCENCKGSGWVEEPA